MEKCTFCIQRIRKAEMTAEDENRPLRDGEVVPACVQSCPTRAMTFGDMSDTSSEVYRLARNQRAGKLLDELGTKPRVVYLKGLREG
jgi:molybdopterin-containing oxidoreductase family iron-sulfur binding subunit